MNRKNKIIICSSIVAFAVIIIGVVTFSMNHSERKESAVEQVFSGDKASSDAEVSDISDAVADATSEESSELASDANAAKPLESTSQSSSETNTEGVAAVPLEEESALSPSGAVYDGEVEYVSSDKGSSSDVKQEDAESDSGSDSHKDISNGSGSNIDSNGSSDGSIGNSNAGGGNNYTGNANTVSDNSNGNTSNSSTSTSTSNSTVPSDIETMDYEKYQNLSAEDQQVFFEGFGGVEEFFEWYNAAKKEYEENQNIIEIDGSSAIDFGEIFQ